MCSVLRLREREKFKTYLKTSFPILWRFCCVGFFSTKGAYERFQSGNTGDYRPSLDHSYAQKQM